VIEVVPRPRVSTVSLRWKTMVVATCTLNQLSLTLLMFSFLVVCQCPRRGTGHLRRRGQYIGEIRAVG
jgi:hypothetical protein